MSTLTSLFVSNHHDHAKLLSPFGKQLEHVVSNFGPEVFFFFCFFFFFTNSYIYIFTTTTNNEQRLVAMEDDGQRAQTTHLRYGFFVCLFFLLSHRYSCHHHDHGRHVGMEGKDDEQWAQTTRRLGPLDMFFFRLLFFLLSHRYSCHHHDHRRHVGMEGKDDEQWAQTTRRLGPLEICFFCLLFILLTHYPPPPRTTNDTM